MLTIWGRNTSSNVMKVLWLCDELGIAWRREDAGGAFGRTREPAYLGMNPNATVPTLVDGDGTVVWESNAILRYLCATYGGEALYPGQPAARAVVDQWLDWQQTSLNVRMGTLFIGLIRTPEAQRDQAALATTRDQAEALFAILEGQLEGREFVLGDFSIADIAMGPVLHRWFALPIARATQPRLRAWYERLLARPAYAKHCVGALT